MSKAGFPAGLFYIRLIPDRIPVGLFYGFLLISYDYQTLLIYKSLGYCKVSFNFL